MKKEVYELICAECGKEFTDSIQRKFCSAECRISHVDKIRSGEIIDDSYRPGIACRNCGKMFTPIGNAKSCSYACATVWNKKHEQDRKKAKYASAKKRKAEKKAEAEVARKPKKTSVWEAEAIARAEGMSYGKYAAMLQAKKESEEHERERQIRREEWAKMHDPLPRICRCYYCKRQLDGDANFCKYCGNKVEV